MKIKGIIISISITCAFFQTSLSAVDKCQIGLSLFFPEKSCNSFMYTLYEYKASDEIIAEDNEFLTTYYRNSGNDYLANARYFPGAAVKLFNMDSIYIYRYEPSVLHHNYQYILLDLAHKSRILLNAFSKDDYNLFIKNLTVNDYIYLSQLYIVLGNIDKSVYFLSTGASILNADDKMDPCLFMSDTSVTLNSYNEFIREYCGEIKPPVLKNEDDRHMVELYAYIWTDYKLVKYTFTYQDISITSIDSVLVVDRRKVAKLRGIDPDYIRDE